MVTIDKLQLLYQQLDSQASAGEDVVVDLRKEINNMELAYLKEEVLPQVAAYLGAKMKNLRCGLDCSIQYDEDSVISYSFCTTGSMLMIKDSVDAKSCIEKAGTPIQPQPIESMAETESSIKAPTISNVHIVDYSEKAIAVYGDTRQLADSFRSLGGRFNSRLKDGPGWVFSKRYRSNVIDLLARSGNELISQTLLDEKENLFNNSGVKISDPLSEKDWIKLIGNLRCATNKGIKAPHKAIFLLTIIESIRCNYQKENRIYPTKRLEETFRILWNKYVPKDWPFTMNFFQPYAHMSSERFYDIVKVNERANFDINISWNNVKASHYIKYGVLDERLFQLLKNRQFADRITDAILHKYLNSSSQLTRRDENRRTTNTNVVTGYLSGFKKYMLSRTNKHGKPFAASSINVYIGGLKNDYMHNMVKPYSADGLLESVSDLQVLDIIYEKVKNDAIHGVVSNSVHIALRLYIEYRTEKIADHSISIEKEERRHNSRFNPIEHNHVLDPVMSPAVVKSSMTRTKSLLIKSISAEHIHITEGNPTSMIVQFINEIGPELVEEMHIYYLGGELVSKTHNPKYKRASKMLNNGYWVNTNSSTRTKIELIKKICNNLDIDVRIELSDSAIIENQLDTVSSKGRTLFSLNGHTPLNKRQSVLACVRLFMALNPNIPFEVVERNFPPELQGSYGVVAKLDEVNYRIAKGHDDDRRYFLDKDKIFKAKDGVEFVVCHQWGNRFPKFQEHVRKRFGWTLEEVK